ncbi:MAG TPA: DUF4124 domain-containing protein [Tahibacter sp.]|uniref:DUF4124 domain-containing protein n=1 Tax=Tahibacter sp. TaxID=2056211 RepID=UPI002CACC5DE|nr:DUF4124 domain-containing protein [Tahibacter sp.]HSX58978.1 DUF4124 domain-containing protein [Tahibacter sp.]
MTTLLRLLLIAAAGAASAGPAAAATNTGYRCTDANGTVSFQDKPCRSDQQSRSFEYDRAPPPPPEEIVAEDGTTVPADEPVAAAPARPEPPAMPAPPPPRPPPPVLFRCVRADNDKVYFSETGETRPYRVPAGVVGLPGSPLGDNATVSAPELNRPPVADGSGANAIAAAYVEVRDRCEQLVPAEACRALRSQLDENLSRQRGASRDERPGLANEARALADKLAGC